MTDGDIVRIARQIDRLNRRIQELRADIADSDHPNAVAICDVLEDNGIPPYAWTTHCIDDHLVQPERWETGDFGIRRKPRD